MSRFYGASRQNRNPFLEHLSLGYDSESESPQSWHAFNQGPRYGPLEELEKHCSTSAAFDSGARFDPPRCAESTRLGIIQRIEDWVNSDGDEFEAVPSSLFWLNGGAGVGKSALAQTLSEMFHEKKELAASFFFLRSDPSRNLGAYLIPTLVSHLINASEGIVPFVEFRIRKNRLLFTENYHVQIQELLVGPLLALKSQGVPLTLPRLIVIDGLDECMNLEDQCELLRVIARAILLIPYPLRFLVTSRREAHIVEVLNHDHDFQALAVHRYNVSDHLDADMDVRRFLENEFMEIRRDHSVRSHLSDAWPDPKAITSLVERSSAHFIYASTAIRYIRSPKHRPDDRLEAILRLPPPQVDLPYAQLDALYTLVFEGVGRPDQLEKICLVLGILYFQSKRVVEDIAIEDPLQMEARDLVLLLDPIHPLVAVDGDKFRVLHISLFDFLLDSNRGGHLPFDPARVHESAATYILKQKIMRKACNMDDFLHFAYHCQSAYLNDTLKDYLHSLEDPYRKSVLTVASSRHAFLDEFMRSMAIWHLLQTLNRKDFDSTGQIYEQCMEKWLGHPHSKSWLKRNLDKLTKRPTEAVAFGDVKHKLDTLLTEWKPPHFDPGDVGMDPVRRVALIKQEHSVLSATVNTNAISSLIVGDDFVHSFNLEFRDDGFMLLTLRTYSIRANKCYQEGHVGHLNAVQETMQYLKRAEEYLFSDFYQRCGLPMGTHDEMGLGFDNPELAPTSNKASRHIAYRSYMFPFVLFTCCSTVVLLLLQLLWTKLSIIH